ncbi:MULTISPECIES: hypothetical protein [Brasilonema]|uniref:hypothetical protein n=1 Tax=Brasilonema TaxID=383614 RepID=UPI00145F298E|nr:MULTISPECIES: hypothetical protein [Brasilonema]
MPLSGERHMLPCGKPPSGRLQAGKPGRQIPTEGDPPAVLALQRSGSPPAALVSPYSMVSTVLDAIENRYNFQQSQDLRKNNVLGSLRRKEAISKSSSLVTRA